MNNAKMITEPAMSPMTKLRLSLKKLDIVWGFNIFLYIVENIPLRQLVAIATIHTFFKFICDCISSSSKDLKKK